MKNIQKITSFCVDHTRLLEGIYISRKDGDVTTYDLRTRRPNAGDYMDNITMHTVEHLFATYIRNGEIGADVIYFGPMGCQTGFYLLVRNHTPEEVLVAVRTVLQAILAHTGDVFGASAEECGNYRSLSLTAARREAERYLAVLDSKQSIDFSYGEASI